MFIGHLPAGYILTDFLQKRLNTKRFLWLGLLASILPDFDLLYFYFVDNKQTLHHDYWIHVPFYWLCIGLATFVCLSLFRQSHLFGAATIFFANIFLHLFLDTIAGGIAWLYPLSEHSFFLVTVPARYQPWYLSFVFHWTFLLETGVIIWAIVIRIRKRKEQSQLANPASLG